MKTLEEDILGAKFGTKNRAELLLRTMKIKKAIRDIFWMARRYANGRLTTAPDSFNDAYDVLRSEMGDNLEQTFGDGMSHYYDITISTSKNHPYAIYGHGGIDSATNRDLKERKFFKKPKE